MMTDFENFWEIWPRPRKAKGYARKCYEKALLVADAETILAGLRAQLPELQAKEPRYRPHPSTWLNQERWDDDVETTATHQRPYDSWTDDEKTKAADFVIKNGRDMAIRTKFLLGSDIERLNNEGYLGPGKVSHG